MNTLTPFVIISPDLSGLAEADTKSRRNFMRRQLQDKGLPFEPVRGCYQGRKEQAYLVITRQPEAVKTLQELARAYDQESILVVDANRQAYLHTPEGDITHLGKWREVSMEEAKRAGAYTYSDGRYYVAG